VGWITPLLPACRPRTRSQAGQSSSTPQLARGARKRPGGLARRARDARRAELSREHPGCAPSGLETAPPRRGRGVLPCALLHRWVPPMEKHASRLLVWLWKRDSCPVHELTKQCRDMVTLWRSGRRAGHPALPALKPAMQQRLKISEDTEAAGKPGKTLPFCELCG